MKTIKERIIKHLQTVDMPLSAKEIAEKIKANGNSVRPELSKLTKEGKIQRDYPGHYSINTMYDVGLVLEPLRVQNLLVVAEGVRVVKKDKVVLEFGSDERADPFLRVCIEFGRKRGKISWRVKAPLGLDLYALWLCRCVVDVVCESRGYKGPRWIVRNFELLHDYAGVRFEGVKAVTFSDLEGTLEKYYNRGGGVRREVRSSKEIPVESLIALVQGGLPTFQVVQGVFHVGKKVEDNTEAVKHLCAYEADNKRLLRAILEALYRLIDRMGAHDRSA